MIRIVGVLAVVSAAFGQVPRIGDINFYGLQKTSEERVLSAAKLSTGDRLPGSKADLEERLTAAPGIVLARVEAVCCDGSRAILFIGVEERGAPHAAFRSPPGGEATLAQDIVDAYNQYLGAVQRAVSQGRAGEDLTAGHSRMADPAVQSLQDRFAAYAAVHLDLLRKVLREAGEPEERAVAAAVIGYVPNKAGVVDDLQFALQDPDEAVRANAIRSLNAIAVLAARQPALGIKIEPTWFVEMLHSIVLSDRVESVKALLTLADRDPAPVRTQIRERALPALIEMAEWKTLRYALPPFLLLGRVVGLPDQETQQAWQKGDRESVIAKARK